MVIHTLRNASHKEAERLQALLQMKTYDQNLIAEAIAIMKKNGSLDFAAKTARSIIDQAWMDLDSHLPDSPAKKKLQTLASFLIDRSI